MVRKSTVNLENLAALGAERLARLVLDGAERDAGFKKLVIAALAATKGPKAVAALIDRRINGLERGRGFIEWDRAKSFTADLDKTVKTIVDELGPADPTAAVERLIRFVATHQSVFDRVDDSSGRIQDVYETAISELTPLTVPMPEADRAELPDLIMARLGDETHGYLPMVVEAVAGSLPEAALAAWEGKLAARQKDLRAAPLEARDWARDACALNLIACRQALADARGDLDGFIALEAAKHANLQNTFGTAERLLAAGRAKEALVWARRTGDRQIGYMTRADVADGAAVRDLMSNRRVSLEARILEALGDRAAAQDLRWSSFAVTLDAGMLREHILHLEDFEEFDVLDRAFDHVSNASAAHRALAFFVAWPKLDRAARLVVERKAVWDGRHYDLLVPAAEALEAAYPTAATILYRALLNDILSRAKSIAYGHGARYLARLDDLAAASDAARVPDLDKHATFRAAVAKAHARKSGFWAQVTGTRGTPAGH